MKVDLPPEAHEILALLRGLVNEIQALRREVEGLRQDLGRGDFAARTGRG